jgi:hypothetical protein
MTSSSRTSVRPTASSTVRARSTALSEALPPAAITVIPSAILAGVFGIARITAAPPNASSKMEMGTPAASDTNTCSSAMPSASC